MGKKAIVASTEKRTVFVRKLSDGMKPIDAARAAKFANPATEAYRLMRDPEIVEAVREAGTRGAQGSLERRFRRARA